MKGWVGLVSWPTADSLPILPISCRSGAGQGKFGTDVLPLEFHYTSEVLPKPHMYFVYDIITNKIIIWWHWRLVLQPSAWHQLMVWDHRYKASAPCGEPVYSPAFAGIHCNYPQQDGQAELTWVACYTQRWFKCLQMVTGALWAPTWPTSVVHCY